MSNSEENDSKDDVTKGIDKLNIGSNTGEEGDKETASGGRKKGQKEKKEEGGDVTKETKEASGKTANKDTEQASGVRKKGKKKGDCGSEEERTSSPSSEEKVAAKIMSNSEENDSGSEEERISSPSSEEEISIWVKDERDGETTPVRLQLPPGANIEQLIQEAKQKLKYLKYYDITCLYVMINGKKINTSSSISVAEIMNNHNPLGDEEHPFCIGISIWVKDERDGETTPVRLRLPPGAIIEQLIQEAKQNLEYLKYYDITCLYVMINGEKINTSSSISVAEIMKNHKLGDKKDPFCIGVCITIDFLKEMFTTGKALGRRVRNVYLIVKYKSNAMTDDQIRWYENNSGKHAEEFFLEDFKNGKFPVKCRYDLYSNFTPCIDDGRCSYRLINNESPTHSGCEVHIYALCNYWKQHYNKWDWITKMRAIRKKKISIEVLSISIRDELLKLLGSDLSYYKDLKDHLLSKKAKIEDQLQLTQFNLNQI